MVTKKESRIYKNRFLTLVQALGKTNCTIAELDQHINNTCYKNSFRKQKDDLQFIEKAELETIAENMK